MTPELKAKWIAALESGKYTHAKQGLRSCRGHCCLGVLVEETRKFLDENNIEVNDEGNYLAVQGDYQILTGPVRKLLGLETRTSNDLMMINDMSDTKDYARQVKYIKEHV